MMQYVLYSTYLLQSNEVEKLLALAYVICVT